MKHLPPAAFLIGAIAIGVIALALLLSFRPNSVVEPAQTQDGLPTQTQGVIKGFDSYNLPGSPAGISQPNTTRMPGNPQGPGTVCQQDAKLCPDGSYVGRVGPSCQFAACPGN